MTSIFSILPSNAIHLQDLQDGIYVFFEKTLYIYQCIKINIIKGGAFVCFFLGDWAGFIPEFKLKPSQEAISIIYITQYYMVQYTVK